MSNDASSPRTVEALIRADGQGELRDGGRVERVTGADADELRFAIMQRLFALATSSGRSVRVRTIDVDGVYPLVVHASGDIDEDGPVARLQPGDDELTSDAGQRPASYDGGYGALFGAHPGDLPDEPVDVHQTIRLPRPEMMRDVPEGAEERAAAEQVRREAEDATVEPAHERPAAFPGTATEAAVPPTAVGGSDGDGLRDEALDGEFVDLRRDDRYFGSVDESAPIRAGSLLDTGSIDTLPADRAEDADEGVSGPGLLQSPAAAAPAPQPDPAGELAPAAEGLDAQWAPRFPRSAAPEPASAPTATGPNPFGIGGESAAPVVQEPVARASAAAAAMRGAPTLDDFLAEKITPQEAPAEDGWRGSLRRGTGGLLKFGPGRAERERRQEIADIQRPFSGPRTIVVVNPKGGAHKTTATLMIAATLGSLRGGYTLAWDNNETRGTLGWRSRRGAHNRTAVDLLHQLSHFEISGGATIADVDRFVRSQGDAKFDVLASDDDAASAAIIDAEAFSRLHRTLSRFYRVLVVDTGNNMRASNWEAALDAADQLVVVSTAREDTAASAAWLADGLRERGHEDKLANAVTILSSPSPKEDPKLAERMRNHFTQLTRAVVEVPYDEQFVGGGELDIPNLRPATREAWRHAAAAIARGL